MPPLLPILCACAKEDRLDFHRIIRLIGHTLRDAPYHGTLYVQEQALKRLHECAIRCPPGPTPR